MAAAFQSFRLTAKNYRCQILSHRYTTKLIGRRRAFSATPFRGRGREEDDFEDDDEFEDLEPPVNMKLLERQKQEYLYSQRLAGIARSTIEEEAANFNYDSLKEESDLGMPYGQEEMEDQRLKLKPSAKLRNTFINMGEDELIEEEEDNSPGISTLGHGELEAHREKRHYARLAAWEMPLLAKMAKPFVPPTADMPLRFRYTTYLGEQHPAEKKVVMEFCTADMPDLTETQREKLKKLCGVRYNPETDIVKMSCEMFESQAQNKRYLGDRVDELLKEAKDETDTFADIPLDIRHHTFKPKPKFPAAWRMTPKRQQYLNKYREKADQKDQQLMITGQLIDGVKMIENAWNRIPEPAKEALPEMVMAGKGGRAPKRVAMRR